MSYTQVTLDKSGKVDLLPPHILLPPNEDTNAVIAPWTELNDEPALLSHKGSKPFGFPSKPSFSSFGSLKNGSTTTLRYSRGSDAPSIAESSSSFLTTGSYNDSDPSLQLRKSKSTKNMFSKFIRRSRSQQRIRLDSHDSLSHAPPVPDFVSFLPIPGPPSPTYKKDRDKMRGKKKVSTSSGISYNGYGFVQESEINLDTDLDNMKGIVDDTTLGSENSQTSWDPSEFGRSEHSFDQSFSSSSSLPVFSNPFPSTVISPPPFPIPVPSRLTDNDRRRVSPKTIVPVSATPPKRSLDGVENSWTAPESWVVAKEGDETEEPASSSDEDYASARPVSMNAYLPSHATPKRAKPHRRPSKQESPTNLDKMYKIRIYRANNTYYVVSISLSHTVAELTPRLKQKLLESERETHRLYLKERGRERVLTQTERPADIVRRRLEQAGYDAADGLELIAEEGLAFLLKLVYKSQLLGPAEEEQSFRNFEKIDLTGRSLRTVPVALHAHADAIHSLNLSRNPMVEIPLDFIESCTNLRELLLYNMAMKKVPQSIQKSSTLRHLNISCNRIVDLDDAGLDNIPGLYMLHAQNNRMERLPWYFPRLRLLQVLNISNNKFKHLPAVISEMYSLVELDISFNLITELPEEIGQLHCLQRFIIVGNQVTRFPDECTGLESLNLLDCRRNNLTDVSTICLLPKLEILRADYNSVHALDLALGPCLRVLEISHNDITQIAHVPNTVGSYTLISLDISHARLANIDDIVLTQLTSLQVLKLDHNQFQSIPESLGELTYLNTLSCSNNRLKTLPSSIGSLQKLETLDVHSNDLKELPVGLWNCGSLLKLNVTSNFLGSFHDPPPHNPSFSLGDLSSNDEDSEGEGSDPGFAPFAIAKRKGSVLTIGGSRYLPPLAHSLEKLYLGENRLTDEVLYPLTVLKELRILNLSFNDIQELPPTFFKHFAQLEELYLSGNKLSAIPTEDLTKMQRLSVLFLNSNKLQTLPQELGKVKNLTVLDVGSNVLKYNINNWEFDWNWNFNTNLRYLNLSGNKRLQIKSDVSSSIGRTGGRPSTEVHTRRHLTGFTALHQLRVLGLIDVTITATANNTSIDIPDEHEDRRVRTSSSMVNGMSYGIADNLGQNEHLNMFDFVHEFRGTPTKQSIFAMFGRAQPIADHNNRLSKFLYDRFLPVFISQLSLLDAERKETITDALRRAFLKLNKDLHDFLYSASYSNRKMSQASVSTVGTSRAEPTAAMTGASGIVVYFVEKTMYVANTGNALAVVSRRGVAHPVAQKHDPFERSETARIRAAEGWVSPEGYVNGEVDVSRSFGFYHLLPIVNARPYIEAYELNDLDEFVIIGNRGLWDHVSFQTAVDIAREDPSVDSQILAQKLRDFAISYGAEGSTMIMVIGLRPQSQPTLAPTKRLATKKTIIDRGISRLPEEVEAPQGHLALVFTDIRNSTHLWEVNPGMPTAMRIHNNVLRRALRLCGGYEVKTEGDAFMCSFPTTLGAVWFCLSVQVQLLKESWPLEILECEDGKEIYDDLNNLVARGLSVRMGIHCGMPLCERDPNTDRMDYFGPVVNRSARINASAAGGQIMCSADVIREINAKIYKTEPETEYSALQPLDAVEAIKLLAPVIIPMGEHKLKGLEVPEALSAMYANNLEKRHMLKEPGANASVSGSRVQFSVTQMRELGVLCLRLEALSSSRVFRPASDRKASFDDSVPQSDEEINSVFVYGNSGILLPTMDQNATDADLMLMLDNFSVRIENALSSLWRRLGGSQDPRDALHALHQQGNIDADTLREILEMLKT